MNKGFTLVELLGVIVILAIIAVFAFPSVIKIVKENNKTADYKRQMVENAAKLYIRDNGYAKVGERCIDIDDLVEGKYLNDLDIDSNGIVVTYTNGVASYGLVDSCE